MAHLVGKNLANLDGKNLGGGLVDGHLAFARRDPPLARVQLLIDGAFLN